MIIDVTKAILDLDGQPMPLHTGFDAAGKPIIAEATLRRVLVTALWNPLPDDGNLPVETKYKHEELCRLIHESDNVDLSVEDVALLKARVNKAYSHIGIVAGAGRLLDPRKPQAVAAGA